MKWEEVCRLKKGRGLGIKNLLKWVWRFLCERERLWARVIRSRHGDIRLMRGNKWGGGWMESGFGR